MEVTTKQQSSGTGSFCIPRAALNALLANGATAYEVCAYLTLARFTDESGRYTGANKIKGGPIDRALARLKTFRAKGVKQVLKKVYDRHTRKLGATIDTWVSEETDLGPILFDREGWLQATGEPLPDGPHERAKVLYVLPDFGESPDDRVWFGSNLVSGFGEFSQPLKALKNAGDVAARLLLGLYAIDDMETWAGIRPVGAGSGPWVHYEPVATDISFPVGVKLHRAKRVGDVGPAGLFEQVCPFPEKTGTWSQAHEQAGWPAWRALEALQSAGLVYEVVMVLNRNATKGKFSNGTEYSNIPEGAEPFYELDCRSKHGFKPVGEEGIGWATARTAGDLGKPVTLEGGMFDGTYAAFVLGGYGCMIAGIYRLRFRVSNPKNAGIKGAWAGIHQRNKEALELVNSIRVASGLDPLIGPAAQAKAPKEAAGANKLFHGIFR
jgi:hypothetical protein